MLVDAMSNGENSNSSTKRHVAKTLKWQNMKIKMFSFSRLAIKLKLIITDILHTPPPLTTDS